MVWEDHIRIKMTAPTVRSVLTDDSGNPLPENSMPPAPLTYHVHQFEDFSASIISPVTAEPVPEQPYSRTILVKMLGNILRLTLKWNLITYLSSDPILNGTGTLVDELTGGNAILTAQQQYDFLLNTFQNYGIEFKYTFELVNAVPTALYNGFIENLVIGRNEKYPEIYSATLTFVAGNVVTVAT